MERDEREKLEAGHSIDAGHSIAFLHFVTLWLWSLAFWSQNQSIYRMFQATLYTKFKHFGIIRFWVIMQTDRNTDRKMPLNALLPRFVDMSKQSPKKANGDQS